MVSKPWGDTEPPDEGASAAQQWRDVLAHRVYGGLGDVELSELIDRYTEVGVTAEQVSDVLMDGGDRLYQAAVSGEADWTEQLGGPLGVALLAAEVSAFASHLTSRASGIRSVAVDVLLDDYSAITVAAELGVSRQKVYGIAKNGLRGPHLQYVPWRQR